MIQSAFAQATLASRFGPVEIAATPDGLVAIAFRTTPEAVAADVRRRADGAEFAVSHTPVGSKRRPDAERWIDAGRRQLIDYLDGRAKGFDVPLALWGGSAWDRRVLEGVRGIPFGTTLGYGQLARAIGSPGAARAVGGAVGRNPLALVIPCHRVIAGDGSLGGYGGSWPADRDELLDLKRALLELEGLRITGPRPAA
ncbi:MAG: methylated-DNA--[protein]-cysteine S-methyltransferase [Chloroflexota bacterium]